MTITRIKDREIEAWIRLHGVKITLWDIAVIYRLDDIVMAVANRKNDSRRNGGITSQGEADVTDRKSVLRVFKSMIARVGVKMPKKPKSKPSV